VAVQLTSQHRVYGFGDHVIEEIERVEAAGGWIIDGRVCNVLAVSRAFGDPEFKVKGVFGEGCMRVHAMSCTLSAAQPTVVAVQPTFAWVTCVPLCVSTHCIWSYIDLCLLPAWCSPASSDSLS
jgi:hypothetical protein